MMIVWGWSVSGAFWWLSVCGAALVGVAIGVCLERHRWEVARCATCGGPGSPYRG
jgi:hypothetical protein